MREIVCNLEKIALFEYKSLIFHNFPPFLAHCAELLI